MTHPALFQFEHLLIALAVQAVLGWLTGNWWAGAALMSGVLMGREHAQAEYKWIERYGQGRRANLPWWGWADLRVWDVHSWFWNLSLPIAAVLLMAGVM